MKCQHCSQPMIVTDCRGCDGAGGWWAQIRSGRVWRDVWESCPTCHDANRGKVRVCVNLDCPGKVWYPLDGRCAAILRTVRGGAAC